VADVRVFAEGGYRYIKAVFQYSGGVAAQPAFEIERAVLPRPLPLPEGFAAIKAHLKRLGRPLTAFCACELRSPAPFSEQGFKELNQAYAKVLEEWGIYRDGENPVARSNVCPAIAPSPTRCRETAHDPISWSRAALNAPRASRTTATSSLRGETPPPKACAPRSASSLPR
jgi:hypothetical protein